MYVFIRIGNGSSSTFNCDQFYRGKYQEQLERLLIVIGDNEPVSVFGEFAEELVKQ